MMSFMLLITRMIPILELGISVLKITLDAVKHIALAVAR
jgi:hypothetical protein